MSVHLKELFLQLPSTPAPSAPPSANSCFEVFVHLVHLLHNSTSVMQVVQQERHRSKCRGAWQGATGAENCETRQRNARRKAQVRSSHACRAPRPAAPHHTKPHPACLHALIMDTSRAYWRRRQQSDNDTIMKRQNINKEKICHQRLELPNMSKVFYVSSDEIHYFRHKQPPPPNVPPHLPTPV